jgi:hypothetical protein
MADQRQLDNIHFYAQARNDRNKEGYTGFHTADAFFDDLNRHDTRSRIFIPKGPRGTGYYGGSKRRSSGSKRRGGSRRRHGGSRRRHGGSRRRH